MYMTKEQKLVPRSLEGKLKSRASEMKANVKAEIRDRELDKNGSSRKPVNTHHEKSPGSGTQR